MLANVRLAGTDLAPAALAFGAAGWGGPEGDDVDRLYTTYRAAGGNCFDSAHCYAFWMDRPGASERALGAAVRRHDRRSDVIICTKGCHITGGPKYPRPDRYMRPDLLERDLADSLERLQMDYIDLYYLHRDDPQVPVDEIVDALHAHQQAGRIRWYGASNWRSTRLAEAQTYAARKGYTGFVASQILFNLGTLAHAMPPDICVMDDAQRAWYTQAQLPVFAFSSTANGYFAQGSSAHDSYRTPTSEARRNRAGELARKLGKTTGQVALAYLARQPFPVIPLVGTMQLAHLDDALGAFDIALTPDDIRWLHAG